MPRPPLPEHLVAFLAGAHPAVVATVRPDGTPVSAATWYGWRDGRIVLSMQVDGLRHRNVQASPAVSLTVLAPDWYTQLTLMGRVVELAPDPDLADIDELADRYTGEPYPDRDTPLVTALVELDRWSGWGLEALAG